MTRLKEEGWSPDVVVSHSGWGCGLDVGWVFLKQKGWSIWSGGFPMLPRTLTSIQLTNGGSTAKLPVSSCVRGISPGYELAEAHAVVAPTEWQRSQLPKAFQPCARSFTKESTPTFLL